MPRFDSLSPVTGLNNSSSFHSVVQQLVSADSRLSQGMSCSFSCQALTSTGQHGGADVEVYDHVLSSICVHYHLLQPAQCSNVGECICRDHGSCRALPG